MQSQGNPILLDSRLRGNDVENYIPVFCIKLLVLLCHEKPDSLPFKGRAGVGMESCADTTHPHPVLPLVPQGDFLRGEGKGCADRALFSHDL